MKTNHTAAKQKSCYLAVTRKTLPNYLLTNTLVATCVQQLLHDAIQANRENARFPDRIRWKVRQNIKQKRLLRKVRHTS